MHLDLETWGARTDVRHSDWPPPHSPCLAREEALRNLTMKRADWLPAFARLTQGVEAVSSVLFDLPVRLDEKHRPLLCAAIRARCTHFATGDRRDFGHLFGRTVEQVRVVDLLGLAKLLAARGT